MPSFLNPTTSKQQIVPNWYGPIVPKNTNFGTPITVINPNAATPLTTPGPVFPAPSNYQQVINSSLSMLFGTIAGERFWLPGYGLNMNALVFEQMDENMQQMAQNTIRLAITQWEPRVVVLQVGFFSDPNNNQMALQVVLQLVGAPPGDTWTYSQSLTPSA